MNDNADKVHRIMGVCVDGLPFFFIFSGVTALLYFFAGPFFAAPLMIITLWCLWFFRDPCRKPAVDKENGILSPADGKVIQIREVEFPYLLQGKALRVSIFMNIFNVHVNRITVDGVIEDLQYHPGKYFSAYAEKASLDNEQMGIVINKNGRKILSIQIAGLIARRIICRLKKGESVTQNQRFGLIRFGSRVDLYLPLDTRLLVNLGDKVKAGSTWIGEL